LALFGAKPRRCAQWPDPQRDHDRVARGQHDHGGPHAIRKRHIPSAKTLCFPVGSKKKAKTRC
jgi:hypothetical protein